MFKAIKRLMRGPTSPASSPAPMGNTWPQQAYQSVAQDEMVALDILDLVNSSEQWLHRRVEAVDFYDNTTATYRVSLDFTVPPKAPVIDLSSSSAARLLPITMLAKRPLANFDVRDESGRSLPVLTTEQNAQLAHKMLIIWARGILDAAVPEPLTVMLNHLVRARVEDGPAAFEEFGRGALPGAEREQATLLGAAEGMFGALVDDLSEHFILMVLLSAEDGDRRVIKISYDQSYEAGPGASFRRRLGYRLGWTASSVYFEAMSPILAESHHFEVVEPTDVDIVDFTITRTPGSFRRIDAGGRHVHAHLGRVLEGQKIEVTVGLLPERRGWLRGCWVGGLAITALLSFLAFHLDAVVPQASSATGEEGRSGAALLLALAGLVASILNRTREHALATDLLVGLRWVAGIPPACAFALAAVLTVGPESRANLPLLGPAMVNVPLTWYLLTFLSAVAAVIVTVAMRRPWRHVTPAG